ncbi:MAG: hypothetical protein ISS25_02040 [Nanoarchaeota archaeon]|nr:hypothetical protein [DPANN group archaeon]MBL7116586.1 hypothetical protein [Nanoarchaeota archaeon]
MLEKLQKIGLSEKESHIYLALVKSGESTANKIAKQTATNRTVTYNVLQQLVEKGLVTYIHKDKIRLYVVAKPEALLSSIKEKETLAKDLISEINKIKVTPQSFKNVAIYEGLEGMKVIFDEIRRSDDLRVINATGLIFEYLKYSAGHIVKDIELYGNTKVIANQSLKKTPLAKFKINIKYLPKEAENYATTFIFKEKVIIQVLKDKPFLIKIENKEIYDGYKKDFDVLWSKL